LKSKLQQVDYGNVKKEILKLRRSKIKKKSDFKRYKAKTSLEIRNLKIINSELQKEVSTLQIINENLKVELDDTIHDSGVNTTVHTKINQKTYNMAYRKAAYHCLSNQVPVEKVGYVIASIVK